MGANLFPNISQPNGMLIGTWEAKICWAHSGTQAVNLQPKFPDGPKTGPYWTIPSIIVVTCITNLRFFPQIRQSDPPPEFGTNPDLESRGPETDENFIRGRSEACFLSHS